jgi:hypothetical protein
MIGMQCLARRQAATYQRDSDPLVSISVLSKEHAEQHRAKMSKTELERLGALAGDIQEVSLYPRPHVEMYTIDGLRLVAYSMGLGLSAVWYCDTTGDLVRICCSWTCPVALSAPEM